MGLGARARARIVAWQLEKPQSRWALIRFLTSMPESAPSGVPCARLAVSRRRSPLPSAWAARGAVLSTSWFTWGVRVRVRVGVRVRVRVRMRVGVGM